MRLRCSSKAELFTLTWEMTGFAYGDASMKATAAFCCFSRACSRNHMVLNHIPKWHLMARPLGDNISDMSDCAWQMKAKEMHVQQQMRCKLQAQAA